MKNLRINLVLLIISVCPFGIINTNAQWTVQPSTHTTTSSSVGIGVLNPTAKLDLEIEREFNYTKESGLRVTYPIPVFYHVKPGKPPHPIINKSIFEVRQNSASLSGEGFSSKFIVKSNGYVGIGEFEPSAKLHVNGDAFVSNGLIKVMGTNGFGGPQIVFGGDPGTNSGNWGIEYYAGAVKGLNFWVPGVANGNFKMFLADNGKVSIGLDPSKMFDQNGVELPYKLFVEQGILTERLKVALRTSDDWADYVFKEGYQLKTIKEVETYIEKEGHLPGVPSAEEVKETGIDVATMDAKLLEKIEELTLYVIRLNNANEELKREINELKK